jgi:hypothetical protein
MKRVPTYAKSIAQVVCLITSPSMAIAVASEMAVVESMNDSVPIDMHCWLDKWTDVHARRDGEMAS